MTVPTRPPSAAYLASFLTIGLALSMNGPALAHLRERAHVGIGASGMIIGGQAFGYILGSLAAGRPYDRGHGHRVLLSAGTVLVTAAASLMVVRELWQLVIVFAVIGGSAAMIDVGGNTLLMWSQPVERVGSSLNALHLCFGVGALVTPLLVSRSIAWHGDLALVAGVLAIAMVVIWRLLRDLPVPQRREPAPHHDHVDVSPRAFALVCGFFFLYVGAEVTFAGWVATYAEAIHLGGSQAPALLTSTFFGGFTFGRIVAIAAVRRLSLPTMLIGTCALATTVALGLALAGGSVMVWGFTALFGFVMGPQFASMMAFGDQRLRLSGASTSLIVASSGLGGLIPPVITGWVLDRNGADVMPWAVLVVCGLTTVITVVVVVVGRQRPPVTSTNAPVV